jgi:hypothetical protein
METLQRIPKEHHTAILYALNRHLGPCTVYALDGRGETNGCLLAFANPKNPQGAAIAANQINESTDGLTVSILLHKPTDLATKQQDQQWFFYNALRGHRLCLDKTGVPYWPHDYIPERNWKEAHTFWLKCEAVANFNINAASESQHMDVALIKIALLHEAMVQVSLGLIRVFLGYTPNIYSLRFLLSLCGHFCELPSRIFPQETFEQQQLFKRLCTPASMLRHWNRLDAPEGDVDLLLDECNIFLKEAKALAEHQLQLK